MTRSPSQPGVDVALQTFSELFANAPHELALDSYQRSYVWNVDKVKQLLIDLRDHQKQSDPSLDYYMGTILLHASEDKKRLFIIDGQQRLTALSILHHEITGELPNNCGLSYRSPVSIRNIKATQDRLRQAGDLASIFDQICFTVITVASEDLAFTFFDTQNNRGVPLNATDLLKSYHLRAIAGSPAELALQTACARRWERLQKTPAILGYGADFAPELFGLLLWRARCWKGRNVDNQQSDKLRDDLIAEFQTLSICAQSPDTMPLYATVNNRRGTTLTLLPHDEYHLMAAPIRLGGLSADLPFAIRQPISRGVGFFLYADKYADLARQILNPENTHPQIKAFKAFHDSVMLDGSRYLREIFLLASVMYIDQFGPDQLMVFALWLEHVLGAIRIQKQYVFAQAVVIFLRDAKRNLLDVIAGAFRPEEVVSYLRDQARDNADSVYVIEAVKGAGVQGQYKRRLLRYYIRETTDSLKGKSTWITDAFIAQKVGET